MQDTDLRRELEDRLADATAKLKATEAEVTRLKRHVQGLRDVLSTIRETPPAQVLFQPTSAERSSLADLGYKNAARTVLLEVKNTPMTTRGLLEVIQSRGKHVGGKAPLETLRAILRAHDEVFMKTPDSKWMLVDQIEEPELEERGRIGYEPPEPD